TADAEPAREDYEVRWIDRSVPPGARHVQGVRLIAERARAVGVVYSTGMLGRSALGTRIARTPIVMKLTADPAFERARPGGLWRASRGGFQGRPSVPSLPLRLARDADVRRAAHVVTPSDYLRELALGWGVPPHRATVLPNPAPPTDRLRPRDELRREL